MHEHPEARLIVDTLARHGFAAYYAGGWVRDFLLQRESDDIDIATSAPPETIQHLFTHTVPIGISFGIILVIIDGHQYEVATFRQDIGSRDGRRPESVSFSSAEEDAKRRDFTVNGMFYDPIKGEILDFVGGKDDLKAKIIRAIGNPHERIKEDRLRMIRGIRLACRFHFAIEKATDDAIRFHANELFPSVAIERVCQELSKALSFETLRPMLIQLHDFGLLPSIFPELQRLRLEEIERRLEPLKEFPKDAPLIAHLLELFPEYQLENALKLCELLKLSRQDHLFVSFWFQMRKHFQEKKQDLWQWAHLYADPRFPICLSLAEIHLQKRERTEFVNHHQKQIQILRPAIERIQTKNPLIKAADLIELGIPPGEKMGILLKEAEKISINKLLQDKAAVLLLLQRTAEWNVQ